MEKKFTITGVCIPEKHYMSDTSEKMAQVMKMVEDGEYFTINRPRQYGKTTTLSWLMKHLQASEGYVVFKISLEGVGDETHQDEEKFCQMFIHQLARFSRFVQKEWVDWLMDLKVQVHSLKDLSDAITSICERANKKVVVLIDEVDKSSNFQLFLNFLGTLRTKYLDALDSIDLTFHSVILAGVHDIKTLKLKIREGSESTLNSPWNIAADFNVNMDLLPTEIEPMLAEYAADKKVKIDTVLFAEKLYYYTSGYPFLVSKLCKIMDEEILPERSDKEWTLQDLQKSVRRLIYESNANFDSLSKNLENYPDLYELTYRVVIDNEYIPFVIHDTTIRLGVMFGVFAYARENGLNISNRIYLEVITNYMIMKTLRTNPALPKNFPNAYMLPNNALNVTKILTKFQDFMKEQHSEKDRAFLEREGRLVFLSFLKPIINGGGYAFKEPQISEERRMDITITFYNYQYVIELKVWYGEKAHQKGLLQLNDYLNKQGLSEGWLVIFDPSKKKTWKQEQIEIEGKSIFA
ncbi:MAG: AAA family ATPase, partial [Bacteroidota bacterium]